MSFSEEKSKTVKTIRKEREAKWKTVNAVATTKAGALAVSFPAAIEVAGIENWAKSRAAPVCCAIVGSSATKRLLQCPKKAEGLDIRVLRPLGKAFASLLQRCMGGISDAVSTDDVWVACSTCYIRQKCRDLRYPDVVSKNGT